MQKQPQLPYSMTAPSDNRRKCRSSPPHNERSYCRLHFRDNGRLGDSNGHHILPQLTPGLPAALPIPRADRGEKRPHPWQLAVTKTARGIALPRPVTAITLVSKLKLLPRLAAGNSRDRSRQSDHGVAASGQKTATGHPETTRANAMRPLAVQRPPTTAPGKIAIETIHAHSVVDCLAANEKRSDSASKSGPKAPSWLPKPKIGKPGRNPNRSVTPKTLPPHHLAGRAEMRRERQPRTE